MHEEDESWASGADRRERRRHRLVIAMAGVPWLVVAALLITGRGDSTAPASATVQSEPGDGRHERHAASPPPPGHQPDHNPELASPAGTPGETTGTLALAGTQRRIQAAAAAATAVARAWITGIEPHLEIDGIAPSGDPWYVEHLVVEAVDVHAEIAIVTLLATVIGNGGAQLDVDLRRVAVPMLLQPTPQPAGDPWWLPEPQLSVMPPASHRVESPEVLHGATEALVRAGYRDARLLDMHQTDRGHWIAQVEGVTPAGQRVGGSIVLYPAGDGFVVGGASHIDGAGMTFGRGSISPALPGSHDSANREGGR